MLHASCSYVVALLTSADVCFVLLHKSIIYCTYVYICSWHLQILQDVHDSCITCCCIRNIFDQVYVRLSIAEQIYTAQC